MLILALAASLSLINVAPGAPAAASFVPGTPIVVADNDTRHTTQSSTRTSARTTTRVQSVQRAPAVMRAPAMVRQQPARFEQTPVRSVDTMRVRVNAAQQAQFHQIEVMRARMKAAAEAQAHQAAVIRSQENAARIQAHAAAVERARINAAQESQLHQTQVMRARMNAAAEAQAHQAAIIRAQGNAARVQAHAAAVERARINATQELRFRQNELMRTRVNAAERARVQQTDMLRRAEVMRARANAFATSRARFGSEEVRERARAFARIRPFERARAFERVNAFPRGDSFGRNRVFERGTVFENGNGFVNDGDDEARVATIIQERTAINPVTPVFVVPTSTFLQPTVVQLFPPSGFVTQEAFFTEPAFETMAQFGDEAFDDAAFTNQFFAPAGFVEPTTFLTPVGFFEPTPIALAPVAFAQPAFIAPSDVAISGNVVAVNPASIELATAAGLVTALLGSSTFIEGNTGFADGVGLVPGENVTVFGLDNSGFVDASTVRINGGIGAVNDVMLQGVVSLANPGLGGFVMTQEEQPTMVMLTPQTVIEENAAPVGFTAIAPAEPVTVLGTVSNGVFVADRVLIAG